MEIGTILRARANPEFAKKIKIYLKSPFDFYGIKVPELRKIAKEYKNLPISEVYKMFNNLWDSSYHEEKMLALFVLSLKRKEFDIGTWEFILGKTKDIKTWDVCDEMSSHITGEILAKNLCLMPDIKKLAESSNAWQRRVAMISTIQLIRQNKIELTFNLAEKLAYDEDIYVQKAAGWMLREAGKKNNLAVKDFIMRHLDMKPFAFSYATEKMLELRKIKKEMKEKK
jgi:3-methyladenine DNA glycosylase AlkD